MVAKPSVVYNGLVGYSRVLFAFILLAGLVVPGYVYPQKSNSVVVLPFSGSSLTKAELASLTRVFEESLSGISTIQVIDQVRREKVLAYLDPRLLTSDSQGDAVTIGEALVAATVVTGAVVAESGVMTATFKMIDVETSRAVSARTAGAASFEELSQAVSIAAFALFGVPLAESTDLEDSTTVQARQQGLAVLSSMRADLRNSIAEIDRRREKALTLGWVSLGVGVASAALSGLSLYLSHLAYDNYRSTSDTVKAEHYRRQVVAWDSIMMASGGAGALCVGISIPFFVLSPNSRDEAAKLKRVEADITSLTSPEGGSP
jgi:hypothetical protein